MRSISSAACLTFAAGAAAGCGALVPPLWSLSGAAFPAAFALFGGVDAGRFGASSLLHAASAAGTAIPSAAVRRKRRRLATVSKICSPRLSSDMYPPINENSGCIMLLQPELLSVGHHGLCGRELPYKSACLQLPPNPPTPRAVVERLHHDGANAEFEAKHD